MDVAAVRVEFPALGRHVNGAPAAYLDGPGGTQVPRSVIGAMAAYMERGGSNHHGPFVTSQETDQLVEDARGAVADLYGARPSEISFGQNMTSITYSVSRALGRTWAPGDNIVLTRLDHDANVTPWVQAASEADVEVRFVDFVPEEGCALDLDALDRSLDARTRLVAFTNASNAVGTITPVATIVERAHDVGALTYVDAVHYTPHGLPDVSATDTDFLVSSAYKWFGPHTGCLYAKESLRSAIEPYKIRPAPDAGPDRWETGTQSFESLAGVVAAVDYLASLGDGGARRARLTSAYRAIEAHEGLLAHRFLRGLAEMPRVTLFGQHGSNGRTPTFAIDIAGRTPQEVARSLGEQGIFVWAGDYYAVEVMARLGRADHGLTRIGFVHYSTTEEVDRTLDALEALT